MKLLFDIGNTRTKYVLLNDGELSDIHYLDTSMISANWLSEHFADITECAVANVSQDIVSQTIVSWCQQQSIGCQVLETEKQNFGIRCAYSEPSRLGVDRWLVLVGARQLFAQQNCLIVDAGTATTVDLLTANGEHKGGWILPGIKLLFDSLLKNTEKIAAQAELIDEVTFADNTSDAVNQASWAATLGLINSAKQLSHDQYSIELNQLTVILTGGNARQLSQLYLGEVKLVDKLLFVGMQAYC
ncbi:type III pantothenate kinase [Thalassotalea insulae]|uniref:Type III pantothenate kinase n=1 Tax=Thalassotalea insulae TaxID=2056778 RepID=A0ABQ6GTV7_9GAMM|nr:type III pantothenate kinase [Thalassotalea insulae]GLX78125.1 type III pantothenate kinase [Thalassotalea insulae]